MIDLSQNNYIWNKQLSKKPAGDWALAAPQVGAGKKGFRVKPEKPLVSAEVSALGREFIPCMSTWTEWNAHSVFNS